MAGPGRTFPVNVLSRAMWWHLGDFVHAFILPILGDRGHGFCIIPYYGH